MEDYQGEEGRVCVKVIVDLDPYKQLRGILFRNGLSFQEYVNFVVNTTAIGDEQTRHLIEAAKNDKTKKAVPLTKRTNPNELFNLLEEASALKAKH